MSDDPFELEPCEACGAGRGQQCDPECPSMVAFYASEGSGQLAIDGQPAEWKPDEMSTPLLARQILFRALCQLPFAGLVSTDPPYFGEHTDDDLWLAEVAVWMANYAKVANDRTDDLSDQARQRVGLQIEKDVLRGFLGEAITEKLEALT